MREFVATLARLTASRKPRNLPREVLVGAAVGALVGLGGSLSPEWTFVVVLLYFAGVQAVSLTDNEVFSSFADFRRLGFREPTAGFRAAYVAHYVARDMYVANAVALAVGAGSLVLAGQTAWAVLLPALFAVNMLVIPSHVHLASRLSEKSRTRYILAMVVASLSLAVPLVAGLHVPSGLVPALPVLCVALGLVHTVLVDRMAARLRGNGLNSYGSRRWFTWAKRLSPHLFKDLVLFSGMAVQALVVSLAMFAILIVGTPPSMVTPIVMVAVCHDNLFLARRDGGYRILTEDPLFSEGKLRGDVMALRRRKLRLLALDLPLRLALASLVLALYGQFRLDHVALMALVMATALVVEAPLPWVDEVLTRRVRAAVGWALVIGFAVVVGAGMPLLFVVGLCALVLALHAPTFVRVHVWGPRSSVAPHLVPTESAERQLSASPLALRA